MNFTVEWTAEALAQLAATWNTSDDRDGVTAASYRIEAAIQADPMGAGESRSGNRRYVFDEPLAVIYQVYPDQRLALVITAGPSRPRR